MLINLDGNIVNRFGDRFPVPFMEKINVNNTHIDIDLSFYFMKDNADEGDVLWNEYVSSLSDLQYSIVMVPDFIAGGNGYDPFGLSQEDLLKKYGPIQYNQTGTGLFSRIKTGELNILDIVVSNDQRTYEFTDFTDGLAGDSTYIREQRVYYAEGKGFYKLNESNVLFVNQLNLLDTTDTWTTETHYDASNNEIVKFIKTIRIENASPAAVVYSHLGQIINAMKNGLKTHFVAFTTSLDNTVYPNNFTPNTRH